MSEVEVEVGTGAQDPDADFFTTSDLPTPPAVPDVHFGTIEAVYLNPTENEDWPAQFVIKLRSENVPTGEFEYKMILPRGYYENVDVDASTLPESAQMSYRIGIANADGDAFLEQLRGIARDLGRTPRTVEGLTKKPTTIEEVVNNYALLLTGLEIAFYRNVNKKAEPRFAKRLEVKGIMKREDAAAPKAFKKGGYIKLFEQ
jgi:hypothetical protein